MAVNINVENTPIYINVQDEQTNVEIADGTLIISEGTNDSVTYLRVAEGYLQYSSDNETWSNIVTFQNGQNGADGVGIQSVAKTATNGLVDTYTITLTNGVTSTFTVTNGQKGDKGDKGDAGSDANVTSANITNALGYTPANQTDVTTHTNNLMMHVSSAEKQAWNAKSDFSGNYGDLRNQPVIPSKTSQLENDSGFVEGVNLSLFIAEHNTSEEAHNDLRLLIDGLTSRLNALANSDDTTLDQMAEVVAYIKNNKTLIDGITTGKVSVSDIIDNLTTSVSNKPLSAKQGVELKKLIDEIIVPTKTSQLTDDVGYAKQTEVANLSEQIVDEVTIQNMIDTKFNSIVNGNEVAY